MGANAVADCQWGSNTGPSTMVASTVHAGPPNFDTESRHVRMVIDLARIVHRKLSYEPFISLRH
jgi:hypothetical protein